MRFIAYERNGTRGLAVADQAGRHWGLDDGGTHGRLESALASGRDGLKDLAAALLKGEPIDPEAVTFLPPLSSPSRRAHQLGLKPLAIISTRQWFGKIHSTF